VSNGPIDSNDPTGQIPAIALLFTPPGLAALTAAGEWTLFVASAALVAIGLAEMTAVEDPPQALPPSTPTLPPPALPPAIPTTPSTPAMPMSQPTPAPPLPVPVPTTSPTNCPDPCDAFRKIAQAGATVQAAAWPSNLRTAKAREIYLKLLRFKGCADDGWNK
jgi:hypothetical protein